MYTLLSRGFKRLCALVFFCLLSVGLGNCGGAVDDLKDLVEGVKDLHGAIGFKPGADSVVAPLDASCGPVATAPVPPNGRCLTAAEAANAIAQQCPDCKVVLTYKATSASSLCGSIALTGDKLRYGVGTGTSVVMAQEAAIAACKASEGAVTPSTCAPAKTRCL